MKALTITRPGGPDVLAVREAPDPEIGPEDVLVRVRASALNRADLLQRRGLYPAPPGVAPDVPGLEFAGEVEAHGALVRTLGVGTRVMGIVAGGGQAERLRVHERMCLPVPGGLDFVAAAAIPEAFLTAYDALFVRGRLRTGASVLIHAAGSGVGLAAAMIAREAGARPALLSRSSAKRERLQSMGFERVFDPTDPDLAPRIRGVNVVIDFVGAAAWAFNVDVLAPLGRLVLVGTMSGSKVEADLAPLMVKRLTVVGTVLRSRPLEEKIALTQAFARDMLPLFEAGRLAPIVDRVLPLEEAGAGHAAMERNENFGKIVLTL